LPAIQAHVPHRQVIVFAHITGLISSEYEGLLEIPLLNGPLAFYPHVIKAAFNGSKQHSKICDTFLLLIAVRINNNHAVLMVEEGLPLELIVILNVEVYSSDPTALA